MAFDAPTILTLTVAIAAAAALYMLIEWRIVRDPALLLWGAGFASVALGSALATLRSDGLWLIGIWFADGLLVLAHWFFLRGVARFAGARLSATWWLVFIAWLGLLVAPGSLPWFKLVLLTNSVLVAILTLRAAWLMWPAGESAGAAPLRYVLLAHGVFYLIKTIPVLVPGSLINLASYRGAIIQVSLVEGVMALLLIALSMTGCVRYRREREIEQLAERDPLTALFNRRAFEARAARVLAAAGTNRGGALLLIDIDNFKLANDGHGHAAGDRLLVMLGELIRALAPGALAARLGGDEFALVLSDVSSSDVTRLGDTLRAQFHAIAAQAFDTPEAVTLSIGATLFDRPTTDLSGLIEASDGALYDAKRGGRNKMRAARQPQEGSAARAGSSVDVSSTRPHRARS